MKALKKRPTWTADQKKRKSHCEARMRPKKSTNERKPYLGPFVDHPVVQLDAPFRLPVRVRRHHRRDLRHGFVAAERKTNEARKRRTRTTFN